MKHPTLARIGTLALAISALPLTLSAQSYQHFESPQTSPVCVSPDGESLFAVNTPDGRVSVFDIRSAAVPILVEEIRVGLEPVSVRARTDDEAWVVNHVSDTISVVSRAAGRAIATIAVPDEPCDVVFAGNPQRAFVSAARSNAVIVIDVASRQVVTTLPLQGEHPRALTTSLDGSKVYVAFALSGNRTTSVPRNAAPPQGSPTNPALPAPPQVARIVDATDPAWFPSVIRHRVLDHDVAEIDAQSGALIRYFDSAGTVNFDLAVQPGSGDVFVVNTDARNLVRFEPNLRGHVVDNRVTRITTTANPTVTPIDLNPGIDYGVLPNTAALATALAQPTAIVFDPSGAFCWIAAFGTDRVAKVSPTGTVLTRIEVGPTTGAATDPKIKRGPRGLALSSDARHLYVLNRLSNTLSVIDTGTTTVGVEVPIGLVDPTPWAVKQGRGFLYDAKLSGNGTVSCASCHIDGEEDHLAWDLGDPAGVMETIVDPSTNRSFAVHPMKGPMTTQTMKGLDGTAPFHWRGDRSGLPAFNAAFDKLMGGAQISNADMALFQAYVDSIKLQPNPLLRLDRTMPTSVRGADPYLGLQQFQQSPSPGGGPNACASCHSLPNQFIPRIRIQSPGDQPMKPPFMRSYYKKNHFSTQLNAQNVIGFGLEHDGTVMPAVVPGGGIGAITAFFLSFDTGTAPAVGTMRVLDAASASSMALAADLATLESQAVAANCELVATGTLRSSSRALLFDPSIGQWRADQLGIGPFTTATLLADALAGDAELTFLGVPFGQGSRMSIDRDGDGILDRDEVVPAFTAYASGCSGSGGFVPNLSARGLAGTGTAFALDLDTTLGGAPSVLGVGLGDGTIDLGLGCQLAILPLLPNGVVLPLANGSGAGNGRTSMIGRFPPSLPMTLHFQALVLDVGSPQGFALSNALRADVE